MSSAADGRGREADRGLDVAEATARIAALENLVGQYQILLETSAAITASTDLGETLELITRLVTQRLDVAWCDLYDYEASNDEFVVVAFYQLPELAIDSSSWMGSRYDPGNWSELEVCVRERRASIWYADDPGLTPEERAEMAEWGELANMSLPLVYKGDVIGLIDVGESRQMRRWTDDDKRVLQAIADQAAIAIVNARAYTRLAQQAVTDGLTGLFNHRHFDEHLRQEVATARRYGQELSLMMLDVDGFKQFNDRIGHPQGDRMLLDLSAILRHTTRKDVDILARFGGDEFTVILPQTRASGPAPTTARNVAERIAAAVREHRFEGAKGRRDVAMTVSIGVAGLGLGGYTNEELLSSADKALYLAKHQGRDQVSVFGA